MDYGLETSLLNDGHETSTSSDSFCSTTTSTSEQIQDFTKPASGSKRRKQFHPKRSPSLHDPNFRGFLLHIVGKFVGSEWKLLIDGQFIPSKEELEKPIKRRRRKKLFSCSDTEDEDTSIPNAASTSIEKHCASCSVKKTPLWRDAEDGTPLCNACGIRYKKYKMRCGHCWHIPKKDETSPRCKSCGSDFQYAHFGTW